MPLFQGYEAHIQMIPHSHANQSPGLTFSIDSIDFPPLELTHMLLELFSLLRPRRSSSDLALSPPCRRWDSRTTLSVVLSAKTLPFTFPVCSSAKNYRNWFDSLSLLLHRRCNRICPEGCLTCPLFENPGPVMKSCCVALALVSCTLTLFFFLSDQALLTKNNNHSRQLCFEPSPLS